LGGVAEKRWSLEYTLVPHDGALVCERRNLSWICGVVGEVSGKKLICEKSNKEFFQVISHFSFLYGRWKLLCGIINFFSKMQCY
jgi:hypothetical protein